jgi:transcriptional regulator with XRE-family HTH domain
MSIAKAQEILGMSAESLKELIDRANLTPTELAAKVGTTRKVIYSWCKPDADMKVSNYIRLAEVLGVSLKTLAASIGRDVSRVPNDIGGDEQRIQAIKSVD